MIKSRIFKTSKIALVLLMAIAFFIFFSQGWGKHLTLSNLKEKQQALSYIYSKHPLEFSASYFLIYVLMTAISLPGATILTLAGGAVFGIVRGTVLVSFASTLGATLAFLGSRFLFRKTVQDRFGSKISFVNRGFEKEGKSYLLTLRLLPIFPFFLVNLVMGVTAIPVSTFYLISQIGMLPATLIYVNAGTQLATIESVQQIFSARVLLSLSALGAFPLLINALNKYFPWRKKD